MVRIRFLLRNVHMYSNEANDDKFIEIFINDQKMEYLLDHGYFIDKVWSTTEKEEIMLSEMAPIISMSD